LEKKLRYRIQRLSEGFYAFSIWSEEELLFLYTGKSRTIKARAKEFKYDINLRMKILNRPDYELDYICG